LSPISCRSSAGHGKFAGQRPTFYYYATQPWVDFSRTCRRSAAVVGDDAVDESLLNVRLYGDEISSMVSAAADRRLAELYAAPVHDVARPDTVQTWREVIGTEACLHRRCSLPTSIVF